MEQELDNIGNWVKEDKEHRSCLCIVAESNSKGGVSLQAQIFGNVGLNKISFALCKQKRASIREMIEFANDPKALDGVKIDE